jgi:Zinc carboxypeptidase
MMSGLINQALINFAAANPTLCQTIPLQASSGGNPITAVKLSDPAAQDRIPVLFIGGSHAREWAPPDALVSFVGNLLRAKSTDTDIVYPQFESGGVTYSAVPNYTIPKAEIHDIFDRFELIVLPLVNPDGRDFSLAGSTDREVLWRKNRRDLRDPDMTDPFCVGVDINRNFPIGWDHVMFYKPAAADFVNVSVDRCSSFIYKGPSAGSEIETQNVMKLANDHALQAFVDVHMMGRTVLYPWGFERNQSDDEDQNFRNAAFDHQVGFPDTGRDGLLGEDYGEFVGAEMADRLPRLADAIRDEIRESAGGSPIAQRRSTYERLQTVFAAPLAGRDPRVTFVGGADDYVFSLQFTQPGRPSCVSYTLEVGQEMDQNTNNLDDDDGGFTPFFDAHFPKLEREVHAGLFGLLRNL